MVRAVVTVEHDAKRERARHREWRAHLRERSLQRHRNNGARERDRVRARTEVAFWIAAFSVHLPPLSAHVPLPGLASLVYPGSLTTKLSARAPGTSDATAAATAKHATTILLGMAGILWERRAIGSAPPGRLGAQCSLACRRANPRVDWSSSG